MAALHVHHISLSTALSPKNLLLDKHLTCVKHHSVAMSHPNSNIFPFESLDPTQLFTSAPAPFTESSAVSLQGPPSDHPREALTEISKNKASKPVNHRGPNWSSDEDVQLCHSWLETSLHDTLDGD